MLRSLVCILTQTDASRKLPRANNCTVQITSYLEKSTKYGEKFAVEIESRLALDMLRKVAAKFPLCDIYFMMYGLVNVLFDSRIETQRNISSQMETKNEIVDRESCYSLTRINRRREKLP